MANIFQKIFLPKSQWIVLDFIDKHADSVRYCLAENIHYKWHNLLMESPDFTLKACSQQEVAKPKSQHIIIFYFTCNQSAGCQKYDCRFKEPQGITATTILNSDGTIHRNSTKFAMRVYNKMMKNYNKIKVR